MKLNQETKDQNQKQNEIISEETEIQNEEIQKEKIQEKTKEIEKIKDNISIHENQEMDSLVDQPNTQNEVCSNQENEKSKLLISLQTENLNRPKSIFSEVNFLSYFILFILY